MTVSHLIASRLHTRAPGRRHCVSLRTRVKCNGLPQRSPAFTVTYRPSLRDAARTVLYLTWPCPREPAHKVPHHRRDPLVCAVLGNKDIDVPHRFVRPRSATRKASLYALQRAAEVVGAVVANDQERRLSRKCWGVRGRCGEACCDGYRPRKRRDCCSWRFWL